MFAPVAGETEETQTTDIVIPLRELLFLDPKPTAEDNGFGKHKLSVHE
jgi:hypothetical protein